MLMIVVIAVLTMIINVAGDRWMSTVLVMVEQSWTRTVWLLVVVSVISGSHCRTHRSCKRYQ